MWNVGRPQGRSVAAQIRHGVAASLVVAFAGLFGLLGPTRAVADVSVVVPATSGPSGSAGSTGFVDTGVSVSGAVTITGSGTINLAPPVRPDAQNITPDGDPQNRSCSAQCLAPNLKLWSLIAEIGGGPWQEIGSGPTTIDGSGEVYLAVNDDDFTDNSGSWSADVQAHPVDLTVPSISGTPLPGSTLTCAAGSWTNDPSAFAYTWERAGATIIGATGRTYVVQISDEASSPSDGLTCVVTATDATGAGVPAASAPVLVAVTGATHCPMPTGQLHGSTIGVLKLGMTRLQARHRLARFSVTQNGFDNFCLFAGWGIRVGYPPNALLKTVSHTVAQREEGRIVIALTANPYFAFDGVRPGAKLRTAARHLKLGQAFHIGLNAWYVISAPGANGVLKVRNGVVDEVGVVARSLTGDRTARLRLLSSFKNA